MKARHLRQPATRVRLNEEGDELEYSVHTSPITLMHEVSTVFPPRIVSDPAKPLLVVPTFQPARLNLIALGDAVEAEKDRLLVLFRRWAEKVVADLLKQGHWADYTDPTSGLPAGPDRGSQPYCDVEGMLLLLPYDGTVVECAGGACRLVSHPKWGVATYPATLFTTAPLDVAIAVLAASAFVPS
eukprot:TRINITY_DN56056_c0_g1_i1.p1 TRINITY_DN56056_c0_g1~~TRINITY_DN56056_c0_g1_i1.p1  ORF type:complete len:197 (+),score=34.81 TRINITY_DN56056_c0_g1_i1:39-593(+)